MPLKDPKPIYYLWILDPDTGDVIVEHNEGKHPLDHVTHRDLAKRVTHEDKVHGYAYRLKNGWRITDWDHKAVKDQYITRTLLTKLRGLQKTAYDRDEYGGDEKWAWVEGQYPETWTDAESDPDFDYDEAMRGQGMGTTQINDAFASGSAEDYGLVAHFEVLARKALANPAIASDPEYHYEGQSFDEIEYQDVVDALNRYDIKWAIGITNDMGTQVGAKGATTTTQDIEQALGVDIREYGGNVYGLDEDWTISKTKDKK